MVNGLGYVFIIGVMSIPLPATGQIIAIYLCSADSCICSSGNDSTPIYTTKSKRLAKYWVCACDFLSDSGHYEAVSMYYKLSSGYILKP